MGFLNRSKSTPPGNANLCRSCAWAQFMTGYGDRERLAVCTRTSPNMVIPFAMLECTGFSDRNRPDPIEAAAANPAKLHALETPPGRPVAITGFTPRGPLRRVRATRNEDGAGPIRTRIN